MYLWPNLTFRKIKYQIVKEALWGRTWNLSATKIKILKYISRSLILLLTGDWTLLKIKFEMETLGSNVKSFEGTNCQFEDYPNLRRDISYNLPPAAPLTASQSRVYNKLQTGGNMKKYVPSLDTRPPLIIGGGAAVLEPVLALPRVSARVQQLS